MEKRYVENISFNGKNHTLSGLYFNEPTMDYIGLFSPTTINEFVNLKFKNVFLYGKNYISTIGGLTTKKVENVSVEGTIKGKISSGIANDVHNIKKCTNYANLYGSGNVSGICRVVYQRISNCINYGNISTNDHGSSGITNGARENSVIENCKNYGKILGTGTLYSDGAYYGHSGIICWATANGLVINNCENYGEITSSYSSGTLTGVGGIAGIVYYNVTISNCANYGYIHQIDNYIYSSGQIAGEMGDWKSERHSKIIIKDCVAISASENPLLGIFSEKGNDCGIVVKNCIIDHSASKDVKRAILMTIPAKNISFENIHCIDKKERSGRLLELFDQVIGNTQLSLKNIIIETKRYSYKLVSDDVRDTVTLNIDGFLFLNAYGGKTTKLYSGTDFSDFVYNRKTGEIMLKELYGTGVFGPQITEKWLKESKGFQKMS